MDAILELIDKAGRENPGWWPGMPLVWVRLDMKPDLDLLISQSVVEIVEKESPNVPGRILRYVRKTAAPSPGA